MSMKPAWTCKLQECDPVPKTQNQTNHQKIGGEKRALLPRLSPACWWRDP